MCVPVEVCETFLPFFVVQYPVFCFVVAVVVDDVFVFVVVDVFVAFLPFFSRLVFSPAQSRCLVLITLGFLN